MGYDFDTVISRQEMNASKWNTMKHSDGGFPRGSVFPYSVADMEFRTAPEIRAELEKLVRFGIFGYHEPSSALFSAASSWFESYHGWRTSSEWMMMAPGVVPMLNAAVRAFTSRGEGVIIQPPVYPPFSRAVTANGRRLELNPLKRETSASGDILYTMDLDGLEALARKDDVRLLILCSPHNPVGRVWTAGELKTVSRICAENGVTVVSDEIHCDILFGGTQYVPFGSPAVQDGVSGPAAGRWLVCVAPSKTFNLAGLSAAAAIAASEDIRFSFRDEALLSWGEYVNLFGMTAFRAAYASGRPWFDSLLLYLAENARTVRRFFAEYFPSVPFAPLEGTYLMWFDCSSFGMDYRRLERFMRDDAEWYLDEGYIFGREGELCERLNIACPRSVLVSGLERFKAAADRL